MNTTVSTGWTPDASPKPATLPQLRALIARLQGMRETDKRANAIAAVDNAIDCIRLYVRELDWMAEAEADAAEYAADARERADLYEMGMGR